METKVDIISVSLFALLFVGCAISPAQDANSIPFEYVSVKEIAKSMGEKNDVTRISTDQMTNMIFLENGYVAGVEDVKQLEDFAGMSTGEVRYEKEEGMFRKKGTFDRKINPEIFGATCKRVDSDGDHIITPTEIAMELRRVLPVLLK